MRVVVPDNGQIPPETNSTKAGPKVQNPAEVIGLSNLYVPNARLFTLLY